MITEPSRIHAWHGRATLRAGAILLACFGAIAAQASNPPADSGNAARFARLALDCIEREYPNKISHELRDDRDVAAPRKLYPAFHGCFDWHSSVHGHWLLVRLLRTDPGAAFAAEARAALSRNLTVANIEGELATLRRAARPSSDPWPNLATSTRADLRQWTMPTPGAGWRPSGTGTRGGERIARWLRNDADPQQ